MNKLLKSVLLAFALVLGSLPASAEMYQASVAIREVLQANRTYYVATTGNDANTCLLVSTPCLTVQSALSKATKIDFNGFTVTVQLADGTYNLGGGVAGTINVPVMVGQGSTPNLVILGNIGTPSNVVITNSGSFVPVIQANYGAKVSVSSFRITSSGGYGVNAAESGVIDILGGMDFGAVSQYQLYANNGGIVNTFGSYTISGGAAAHAVASLNGSVYLGSNLNCGGGAYAFSFAFVAAIMVGAMQGNTATYTNCASITGSRYATQTNGVIQTFGGGANFFPGNAAGTSSTGGQYQ